MTITLNKLHDFPKEWIVSILAMIMKLSLLYALLFAFTSILTVEDLRSSGYAITEIEQEISTEETGEDWEHDSLLEDYAQNTQVYNKTSFQLIEITSLQTYSRPCLYERKFLIQGTDLSPPPFPV